MSVSFNNSAATSMQGTAAVNHLAPPPTLTTPKALPAPQTEGANNGNKASMVARGRNLAHKLNAQLAAMSPENKQQLGAMTNEGVSNAARYAGDTLSKLATTVAAPPQIKAGLALAGKALEAAAPLVGDLAEHLLHKNLHSAPPEASPPTAPPPSLPPLA